MPPFMHAEVGAVRFTQVQVYAVTHTWRFLFATLGCEVTEGERKERKKEKKTKFRGFLFIFERPESQLPPKTQRAAIFVSSPIYITWAKQSSSWLSDRWFTYTKFKF
jgi:hypothetical protein